MANSEFSVDPKRSAALSSSSAAAKDAASAAVVTYDVPVAVAVHPIEAVPAIPIPGAEKDGKEEKEKAIQQASSAGEKDKGVTDQAGLIFSSLLDAISNFSSAVTAATANSKGDGTASASVNAAPLPRHGTTRDMFPRMPWHDIHAFVGGVVARDIASHFVQV